MNFNSVAKDYKNISITQHTASKRLLALVGDNKYSSILDIGCASGVNVEALVKKLKKGGKYFGMDPSQEMIKLSQNKYGSNCKFICSTLEDFSSDEKYEFIFCNSVFYYLKDKQVFFDKCNNILDQDGIIAIQAQTRLCSLFTEAIEYVKTCKLTEKQMKSFKLPANLISEKEFLKILSEQKYFSVKIFNYHIDYNTVDIEKAMNIFKSGPAIPCLSDQAYSTKPSEEFKKLFLEEISNYLTSKSENGKVTLDSPRVYIILTREV
ncbi:MULTISPECIES: class I SAM-dependent methyltransferase [unclassified Francisella]|uniref:class I SAM-dependent methyltransferase n=1 Tax=unclassified Francisella TaxID=2610885 RepID=UPI002E304735|nr:MULTISPECIES: methyltransferase domain-containing protein [unclassified Francisella]MED7818454.1 methyltransferase domain-containing protein [Francisella sp. 19S2-4]MED7829291.1 methyltransferase domain-containing protein [Francisella sp. 19S2-10]